MKIKNKKLRHCVHLLSKGWDWMFRFYSQSSFAPVFVLFIILVVVDVAAIVVFLYHLLPLENMSWPLSPHQVPSSSFFFFAKNVLCNVRNVCMCARFIVIAQAKWMSSNSSKWFKQLKNNTNEKHNENWTLITNQKRCG